MLFKVRLEFFQEDWLAKWFLLQEVIGSFWVE